MSGLMLINSLYRESLAVAMILLLILLYNNIVLYKQKLTDLLSLMLLSSIVICIFELVWNLCDGHRELYVLTYVGACGYAIMFILFAAIFNFYLLKRFGFQIQRKWISTLYYAVPPASFALLCVTTPWTGLVFWMDENGDLWDGILFQTLFYVILLVVYLIPVILQAIYYMSLGRKRKPVAATAAKSLIVFGILTPAIYLMQVLVQQNPDSDYLTLSLACAVALVYLTTNISTHTLLETQVQMETVETELRIAAKIQMDALPSPSPEFADHPELDLRACMHTAKEVGGDFYDYFVIDDHRIAFLIADVSGKGTPAALFMMTAKTMIKDYDLTRNSTAESFTAVNARLSENNKEGMFATAWIGILDTKTMSLQYTNAGHNYPIFQHQGEPGAVLKKNHGLFLAGLDDTEYKQTELTMKPGDRILLYTDGITEAHDIKGGLYGEERLMKVLDDSANESGERVIENILQDVNAFAKDAPQFDDMTMIILTIKE